MIGVRHATAATSKDLLASCEAVTRGAHSAKGEAIEIPSAGLFCWHYFSALQNMSVLVDQNGRSLLGICAPEKTTLLDYVRIVVEYAQQHPQAMQGNAAALAVMALSKAFPCGNKQGT